MEGINVELAGFRAIEESSMAVVNKIISNYAHRLSELTKRLEKLHITLKPVHEREKSEKYDIHVKLLDNGKVYNSHFIDRNLFTAIDTALRKIVKELGGI